MLALMNFTMITFSWLWFYLLISWEIHLLVASHILLTGDLDHNTDMTRNWTGDLSVCRLGLSPLSHTSQGLTMIFKILCLPPLISLFFLFLFWVWDLEICCHLFGKILCTLSPWKIIRICSYKGSNSSLPLNLFKFPCTSSCRLKD